MIIIQLNQQVQVTTYGGRLPSGSLESETRTEVEPIFVVMDNVESFSYCGVTRLKMTSGDVITVEDTPEEILRVLNENKVKSRQ